MKTSIIYRYLSPMLVCLIITGCTLAPTTNRYQAKVAETRSTKVPVDALQQSAIYALAQNNTRQAIEFLQRAIKIEPRNAFSWHYLAQSYQQNKNYAKCLAMVERSYSYSTTADDLDRANQALQTLCQGG
ncbi:MAG: tetratricopeptide repeat protein [Gammaproteobacteria bacterium]|nr:tetratricopeptide repeat protein [Gammaproteobacteria bacterium]